MRKPAVIVAVAVSAVLAGGILVTTNALAESAPDTPVAPSPVVPDVAAVTPLPSDAASLVPVASADPSRTAAAPTPGETLPAKPEATVTRDVPAAERKPAADRPIRVPRPVKGTTAAPKPVETAPQDGHGSVQEQALELANRERRQGGCADLTIDRRLIEAADAHATDMATLGYLKHRDNHGNRVGERVTNTGYQWSRVGENLARGQSSVYDVVDGWMNSSVHRANILDCELSQVGVGLAYASDGTPYWVQAFATPR